MPAFGRVSFAIVTLAWLALAGACRAAPSAPEGTNAPPASNSANAPSDDEDEAPTPAPLTVGSMAIASDTNLVVDSMSADVAADKIIYAYAFRNKGKTKLTLSASVTLPDLEVNNDGNAEYDLPSATADNPIGMVVSVDGKLTPTQPYMQATALGIDRLADLKAAQIPLIPFGDATDKALAAAKPETIAMLEGLGLVTPRDPAQPDAPVIADWSLRVVRGWSLSIDASATSKVLVGFAPIKAVYTIDARSLAGFDALKEQACLTPQILGAAKAMLAGKGATADVTDITLANDGPARWVDNPVAGIAVHKPKPDSVVAFCGMDAATAGKPVVTGKMPSSSDAAGVRVLIFTRSSG